MPQKNKKYKELLTAIYEILQKSEQAYRNYLEEIKTFRYAKKLKKYNCQIINLLTENKYLLSPTLQKDADDLLFHYNTWLVKWNELAAETNPADEDIFVFSNEVTFPREAAQNLEAAYKKLKNQ